MAEEDKEDRLSSLPDFLLLEIISRIKIKKLYKEEEERLMTTGEVIRTTSTISKRWQHLWTKLPNLEIYGSNYTDVSRINKTLSQCPTDVNLNKFTLDFDYTSTDTTTSLFTSQVNSWIRHAITRKVQEVDLAISNTGESFSYDDELFFNNSCFRSMEISFCIFDPPNGALYWEKLKFLHIYAGNWIVESIGKILSGTPCLETLELDSCYGIRRIDATSKRFKNLVIRYPGYYSHTIEINAPSMLSLTIKGNLEKLLLLNVSSLVKADFNYLGSNHSADELGRTRDDIEEELLSGLLSSLGHNVKYITLGDYNCLQALSRLRAKGFKFSRVRAYGDEDRSTASEWEEFEECGDDDMGGLLF